MATEKPEHPLPLTPRDLARLVKAYDPYCDEQLVVKAYNFAQQAHHGQFRASGEPFFTHPLAVAEIATTLKLDQTSIVTALLHDVVEDCNISLQEIEQEFGAEVAKLVDGVTKLSNIKIKRDQTAALAQAENFRKLVLATSQDLRVLLVKLCDRMHNMRTLGFLPKEHKRKKISLETKEIFAPLAERLGMQRVHDDLMLHAFKNLHPDAYDAIERRKKLLFEKKEDTVGTVVSALNDLLGKAGYKSQVTGREKSTPSIWKKMKNKNLPFEQLSDIIAFRILVETTPQCYQVLGLIHSTFPVVPGRFKDYISTPKPNNYQSLHTSVIGPNKNTIEIQIRTYEMHRTAEMGIAAHWEYKQGRGVADQKTFRWLRELLDILDHSTTPEEFLEHTKLEMYQDQVFCFTPKGEIIALPHGATPVDFAYAVHTDVGNRCVGAKINGRIVPLRVAISNGDQIEIITSKNHSPSPAWERFVITGKAKACVKKYIAEKQRTQYTELGRNLIQMAFKGAKLPASEANVKVLTEHFHLKDQEELQARVGMGRITPPQLASVIQTHIGDKKETKEEKATASPEDFKLKQVTKTDGGLSIQGLVPGLAIHYAKCCHPLPGERIVGIIVTGKGVRIHTFDCPNLQQFSASPDRWIDVQWSDDVIAKKGEAFFISRLKLLMENTKAMFASITGVIAAENANISNLKIIRRTESFFEMLVDVEVKSYVQLSQIMAILRSLEHVISIERA